ncbi:hypothetical protein HRI_004708700 [Hibiscus trionum]|uniref:Endonuclease/exonuclease/phosphatase domain-containing protein n=1 Tax=Hibiscus trionum TaxID=183268 RepID=A0A9W7JAQ5_HIBTR|nr:hypothetical protein HRI_004708700 [Hibiscus trionum]
MKLLSWNVRGLGKSRTRKRLQETLRDVNPSVIFLIETKLQVAEMLNVRRRWGFQCGVEVSSRGKSGGLCLAWKMDCDVTLRSLSDRHIDAMISRDSDDNCWRFTGFYGAPEEQLRAESWNLLRHLDDSPDIPWVGMGDFNEILYTNEKVGGRICSQRQMDAFQAVLDEYGLTDLGYIGRWYTWEKGKFSATNIRERLDRGVANGAWWNLFLLFSLQHLVDSLSDHCPLLLDTGVDPRGLRHSHFKFEVAWLVEESCEQEVYRLWTGSKGLVTDRLYVVSKGLDCWFRKPRCSRKVTTAALKK